MTTAMPKIFKIQLSEFLIWLKMKKYVAKNKTPGANILSEELIKLLPDIKAREEFVAPGQIIIRDMLWGKDQFQGLSKFI